MVMITTCGKITLKCRLRLHGANLPETYERERQEKKKCVDQAICSSALVLITLTAHK